MKRFFYIVLTLLLLCVPAAAREISGETIKPGPSVEAELAAYMSLPGVSLTGAQIASLNTDIGTIKYGSGVTLSSLTLNMSTTATGLITGSSVDLRPYSSTIWGNTALVATVSDGTNSFTLTPGVVGTVETLGSTLLTTTWTNNAAGLYETFTSTGGDNVTAGNTFQAGFATSTVFNVSSGTLLKFTGDFTLVSGVVVKLSSLITALGMPEIIFLSNPTTGAKAIYKTEITGPRVLLWFCDVSGSFAVADMAYQPVLTPDANGIVFTNGSGATFDPNLTNRGPYSITITRAP